MTEQPPAEGQVRVRFAPSPSGDLHVGNIRTALYDWAFARHTGGTFVLRIEDTDQSRVTPAYIASALDTLRWLGLEWDEGPEADGPYGPYLQSERLGIYADWVARLLADGHAYYCYCTPEELAERRSAARAAGGPSGYDGHCRVLTAEQVAAYEAEGRRPVVRFRMPEGSTTFTDLVRGEVTFDHAHVPDFVLARADGSPLYTLAVAVDDVLMKITHVVRGEDLLSSTPRQIAVYRAMGVPEEEFPFFAHLPYVLGKDGQRLSKRNGVVSVNWYREEGFLPEAVCNYLALLGWSPGMTGRSSRWRRWPPSSTWPGSTRTRPSSTCASSRPSTGTRSGPWTRPISSPGSRPSCSTPGSSGIRSASRRRRWSRRPRRTSRPGSAGLTEAAGMLGFLFAREPDFEMQPEDAEKVLTPGAVPVLEAAERALGTVGPWTTGAIQSALAAALVEPGGLGLKPRVAYAPVRVAVTGRRVSPPLYESIELLGRERTLARLARAIKAAS